VTFSHDGAYLATGSQGDGTRVWEISSGDEVARLNIPGNVGAVVFSPDDKYVVAGSGSSNALVWHLPIDDLVEEACKRLTRNLTSDEWNQYFDNKPYRKTCSDPPL
jgi:WD40 repeat protein